jgi:D-threo-aldose 1-dehydrogenase
MAGAYRALHHLKSQGVIRAVGVGIGRTDVLVRFAREADIDCFLVAGRYTLLDQEGLAELLPLCVEKKIAVILGGVFNSGILANPRQPEARFNYQPANQDWRARAIRIDEICQRHNVPIKAAALQFPLAHPAVATLLCGATHAHEVTEIVDLLQLSVPRALWTDLITEGLLPPIAPTP